MGNNIKLFDEGLEEYPMSVVLIENLVLAIWILLGTIVILQESLIIGVFYVAGALLMILVVMRKIICTHCYYYGKRCHVGWGKISSLLFKKGNIETFSTCSGQKVAPLLFMLLALIPMLFGIGSLVRDFRIYKLVLVALLLSAILYSTIVTRKKSCGSCKVKLICPGSAVK